MCVFKARPKNNNKKVVEILTEEEITQSGEQTPSTGNYEGPSDGVDATHISDFVAIFGLRFCG